MTKFKAIILLFILFLTISSGFQLSAKENDGTVSGSVIDRRTEDPVLSAKVVLLKANDSTIQAGTFTNNKGEFLFDNVPFGKYYINISYIGYDNIAVPAFQITSKNNSVKLKKLVMEQGSVVTDEVEVTADKQTVEYSMDKKVINVEKNIAATGGSAVDVLSNIPSVSVDYDGNVSLRGSTNLTILIDGKPSQSMGSNRNAILEQIPASSIESVEIISNPSAKYSPEGMNGVLNIVLKKQSNLGFNGLLGMSAGTRDKYSGSINSNYGMESFSLFASYDIRSDRRMGQGNSFRTTTIGDSMPFIEQGFHMNRKGFDNTVKLGTDIFITPKNTLTLMGNYSFDTDNHSFMLDGTELDLNRQISDKNSSLSFEDNKDNSVNLSLNYKRKFDKKDHAFTADATFSNGRSTEGENITQSYLFVNKGLSSPYVVLKNTVNGDKSTNANIELNYSNPFDKDSRYELGYQGIIRNLDNDARYETFNDSIKIWQEDKALNNRFLYKENIHAIYGTYANYFGSFRYQLGVRLEQAYTKSDQQTQSQTHNYDYFSFFPSAHFTYKIGEGNDIQLSYSRRVNRPGVWSLNPFKDISDPLNVRYGNPYLKPEYINSLELGNNKSWSTTSLVSTVFYRQINDVIKRITFLDSNGVANSTSRNLTDGKSYGVEFIIDQTFFKWWRANANFSYFRTIINGSSDGLELSNDNYSWTAKVNTNLTVLKNLNIQINGSYRAPSVTPQGEQKASYNIDIAFKKDFFDEKLGIGFRVSDIFNTMTYDYITRGPGFTIEGSRKRETRVAYLTFSYKINSGIKQKERKRNGNGGSEDDGGGME